MARENQQFIYGYVTKPVRVALSGQKVCRISTEIEMLRKGYRPGAPERITRLALITEDENAISAMMTADPLTGERVHFPKKGDMVFAKATFITKRGSKYFSCPYCHAQNEIENAVITYADAISIKRMEQNVDHDQALDLMREFRFGNRIYIDGFLCRNPALHDRERGRYTELQIASNRARRLTTSEGRTDFPWVRIFGKYADMANELTETGSEVYICGAVQERPVRPRYLCNSCSSEFEAEDTVYEIIPEKLGLRRNAVSKTSALYKEYQDNTGYFYGYISSTIKTALDMETNEIKTLRFELTAIQRNSSRRIRPDLAMEYVRIPVICNNPAQNQKMLELGLHPFDMVIVYGTLTGSVSKVTVSCPSCSTQHIRKLPGIAVNPYFVKTIAKERCSLPDDFWNRSGHVSGIEERAERNRLIAEARTQAKQRLDLYAEISNQVILDVVIDGEVKKNEIRKEVVFHAVTKENLTDDGDDRLERRKKIYPIIRGFGKTADEAAACLTNGSEVLVNGRYAFHAAIATIKCRSPLKDEGGNPLTDDNGQIKTCRTDIDFRVELPEIDAFSLEYHDGCDTAPLRKEKEEEAYGI